MSEQRIEQRDASPAPGVTISPGKPSRSSMASRSRMICAPSPRSWRPLASASRWSPAGNARSCFASRRRRISCWWQPPASTRNSCGPRRTSASCSTRGWGTTTSMTPAAAQSPSLSPRGHDHRGGRAHVAPDPGALPASAHGRRGGSSRRMAGLVHAQPQRRAGGQDRRPDRLWAHRARGGGGHGRSIRRSSITMRCVRRPRSRPSSAPPISPETTFCARPTSSACMRR